MHVNMPFERPVTVDATTVASIGVAAVAMLTGTLAAGGVPSISPGALGIILGALLLGIAAERKVALPVAAAVSIAALGFLAPGGITGAATMALQPLTAVLVVVETRDRLRRRLPVAGSQSVLAGGGDRLPALEGRLALETALVKATRAILRERDPAAVETAMTDLIRSAECDLMLVSRNHDTGSGLESRVLLAAGSTEGLSDVVVWSSMPHASALLSSGQVHEFRSLDEVPLPDRSIRLGAQVRIHATVEHPVMVRGHWVGTVALASISGPHDWSDDELGVVSTVADMLASVWQRDDAVADLERVVAQRDHSLAIQTAITGSARLLFESGEDDMSGVLQLILEALECDAVYVKDVRSHGPHGLGLETRAAALAGGMALPASLEPDSWMSWPPVYSQILEARPWVVTDVGTLGAAQQAWYGHALQSLRSEIAFPIMTGGTVVGLLAAASTEPRQWGTGEVRTVATIAQMLGVARTRADARRNLEDIVKAKDRFIASVSHELRTPMAVVMGLSSELKSRRRDFSDDEVDEFIELISRQSAEVGAIIEDLLVSARASASSITVLPELIRLDDLLDDVLGAMSAEHTRRIVSVDAEQVATFADPLRVRQIIRNLVTNGHRHGGARMFLRVAVDNGTAVLEVTDDGPGIPPDRRQEIFEAYTGGEFEGRTASIGLGLTVSRQLARLMGGDVTYIHEPLPTFRLSLPVGAAATGRNETTMEALAS